MSLAKFTFFIASLAFSLALVSAVPDPEEPAPTLGPGADAFNPDAHHTGSLPLPQPAPGSGTPEVPQSAFFYVLPFIGLWLILRRRHRRVGL